jgi:hypothetical protein
VVLTAWATPQEEDEDEGVNSDDYVSYESGQDEDEDGEEYDDEDEEEEEGSDGDEHTPGFGQVLVQYWRAVMRQPWFVMP